LDGGDDLVNDFGSSRFGKVGDAFDELGHEIFDFGFSIDEVNYKGGKTKGGYWFFGRLVLRFNANASIIVCK